MRNDRLRPRCGGDANKPSGMEIRAYIGVGHAKRNEPIPLTRLRGAVIVVTAEFGAANHPGAAASSPVEREGGFV